jgi:hypothetical protein
MRAATSPPSREVTPGLGRVGVWSRELRFHEHPGAIAEAAAELEELGYSAPGGGAPRWVMQARSGVDEWAEELPLAAAPRCACASS